MNIANHTEIVNGQSRYQVGDRHKAVIAKINRSFTPPKKAAKSAKDVLGPPIRALIGRDFKGYKDFNLAGFEIKDGAAPEMPYDLREHNEAILDGKGLEVLFSGNFYTDSGCGFGYGGAKLPPDIRQWAEDRLFEAEIRGFQKKYDRAVYVLQVHFAADDWQDLGAVWKTLRDYPVLRAKYEKSHGIVFSPHEWIGYTVHLDKKTGKFLVRGLYRAGDIKHMRYHRGPNWESEAKRELDCSIGYRYEYGQAPRGRSFNKKYASTWPQLHVGLPFDTRPHAESYIQQLKNLHLQIKAADFDDDRAAPVLDFARRIAQLMMDFWNKPFEIAPGQVHGPYTVLRYGPDTRGYCSWEAWYCSHKEHGETRKNDWGHEYPYWLTDNQLRSEYFQEEVIDRIYSQPEKATVHEIRRTRPKGMTRAVALAMGF